MKDPKSSYDNDAFEELMKQYLMEDAANDRVADEWMEAEANRVFAEEPVHAPSADKERQLVDDLTGVLAGKGKSGWGSSVFTILLAATTVLLTIVLVYLKTDRVVYTDNVSTDMHHTAPIAQQTQPMPVVDSVPWKGTVQINTINYSRPGADQVVTNYDQIPGVSVFAHVPEQPDTRNFTGSGSNLKLRKDLLRELSKRLELFTQIWPGERLYMHTDRNYYLPGQTIWYSTYLRSELEPDKPGVSEIIKTELVNGAGMVVMNSEMVANNGFANGQLKLPETLPGGVYLMRSYTRWQNDLAESYIFEKPIYIQEVGHNGVVGETPVNAYQVSDQLNVQMNPEGGYLVSGLESRVGVKVTDAKGKAVSISGTLYDSYGQKLGEVTSEHDGMGSFIFVPMANEQYTLKLDNGQVFELPEVMYDGAVISAGLPEQDRLPVNLRSTKMRKVLLVGVLHGQIYYAAEHNLRAGDNNISILLDDMPPGVLHLSLYGQDGLAYGERNVFVNAYKKLNVQIITDRASYLPRSQVQVKLKVTDNDGNPVAGNFSVAVVDDQLSDQTEDNQSNIMASMLLLPEVAERVENPARYFDKNNALAARQLDLLLLNSNWRRYHWKDIYYDNANRPLRNPEVAQISGQILDAVSGKPLGGATIVNKIQHLEVKTNKNGYFIIEGLDLSKPVELTISKGVGLMSYVVNRYQQDIRILYQGDARKIYQPRQNGQLHPILNGMAVLPRVGYPVLGQVLNSYGQGVVGARVEALQNGKVVKQVITDGNGYYTLVLSELKNYTLRVESERYGSFEYLDLKPKSGEAVLLDVLLTNSNTQLVSYQTNFPFQDSSYLKGRYTFLSSSVNIFNTSLPEMDYPAINAWNYGPNAVSTADPAYYIDGRKLSYNNPMYLQQSSIRLGTIWSGVDARYANGNDQANNGGNSLPNPLTVSPTTKPKGFGPQYVTAESFPDISYSVRNKVKARDDLRSTLYWNGQVQTNANGEATLGFFTGDDLTRLRIVVEGLGNNGLTGTGEVTAQVEAPCEVKIDAPDYLTVGQEIRVPISFTNRAKDQMTGRFDFVIPGCLQATKPLPKEFTLFPQRQDTVWLNFTVVSAREDIDTLKVLFDTDGYLRTDVAGIVTYPAEPTD